MTSFLINRVVLNSIIAQTGGSEDPYEKALALIREYKINDAIRLLQQVPKNHPNYKDAQRIIKEIKGPTSPEVEKQPVQPTPTAKAPASFAGRAEVGGLASAPEGTRFGMTYLTPAYPYLGVTVVNNQMPNSWSGGLILRGTTSWAYADLSGGYKGEQGNETVTNPVGMGEIRLASKLKIFEARLDDLLMLKLAGQSAFSSGGTRVGLRGEVENLKYIWPNSILSMSIGYEHTLMPGSFLEKPLNITDQEKNPEAGRAYSQGSTIVTIGYRPTVKGLFFGVSSRFGVISKDELSHWLYGYSSAEVFRYPNEVALSIGYKGLANHHLNAALVPSYEWGKDGGKFKIGIELNGLINADPSEKEVGRPIRSEDQGVALYVKRGLQRYGWIPTKFPEEVDFISLPEEAVENHQMALALILVKYPPAGFDKKNGSEAANLTAGQDWLKMILGIAGADVDKQKIYNLNMAKLKVLEAYLKEVEEGKKEVSKKVGEVSYELTKKLKGKMEALEARLRTSGQSFFLTGKAALTPEGKTAVREFKDEIMRILSDEKNFKAEVELEINWQTVSDKVDFTKIEQEFGVKREELEQAFKGKKEKVKGTISVPQKECVLYLYPQGYADPRGGDAFNQTLSQNRARGVANELALTALSGFSRVDIQPAKGWGERNQATYPLYRYEGQWNISQEENTCPVRAGNPTTHDAGGKGLGWDLCTCRSFVLSVGLFISPAKVTVSVPKVEVPKPTLDQILPQHINVGALEKTEGQKWVDLRNRLEKKEDKLMRLLTVPVAQLTKPEKEELRSIAILLLNYARKVEPIGLKIDGKVKVGDPTYQHLATGKVPEQVTK